MIWSSNPPYLAWLAFMAVSYLLFFISKYFTDSGSHIPVTRNNFGKEVSLRQALVGFFSHPTAVVFLLGLVAIWGFRIYVANWTWFDLIVAVAVVVLWPIVEWVVHSMILHARPRTIFGFEYNPLFSKIHRAHHRDPHHPNYGVVPIATLVQYFFLVPGVLFLIIRWPRPITMGAMAATLAFRYEWWHYLFHSSYKPKSGWFRKLRDKHLLHHFQHEGYWYGVTTTGGDKLFGTSPDPKEVPHSPTVRTLGYNDGPPTPEAPAPTPPASAPNPATEATEATEASSHA